MTRSQIRQIIVETLSEIAPEINGEELTDTGDLRDQIDLDSMDVLTFLESLENRFAIEIRDADAAALTTLDSLVKYIETRAERPEGNRHRSR